MNLIELVDIYGRCFGAKWDKFKALLCGSTLRSQNGWYRPSGTGLYSYAEDANPQEDRQTGTFSALWSTTLQQHCWQKAYKEYMEYHGATDFPIW